MRHSGSHSCALSPTPMAASTFLPHLPDDTRLRNRYGFSVPLHSPSVTVVGKPIYVQRSDGTRRAMTPDEAKVLQGFPYGHDWSHTSTRLALQWYGDAVPPPFASAMGWALVRSHLCLPASWDCCFTPVPRTSLPCSPSCYSALPSGFSSPSLDDVLLSVAQHALPFSMVCCKRGLVRCGSYLLYSWIEESWTGIERQESELAAWHCCYRQGAR